MLLTKERVGRIGSLALIVLMVTAGLFLSQDVYAQTSTGLGGIAQNITKSFEDLGKLMIAVSYLAGIGFAIAAIFKFKQHKDNPTQIPLGTPIALLVIGIALVFLPAFFGPAGETVFGDKAEAGGFTGEGASQLPGAGSQ